MHYLRIILTGTGSLPRRPALHTYAYTRRLFATSCVCRFVSRLVNHFESKKIYNFLKDNVATLYKGQTVLRVGGGGGGVIGSPAGDLSFIRSLLHMLVR